MGIDDIPPDAELAQSIADESEKSAQQIIATSQVFFLLTWFLPPWAAAVVSGVTKGLDELAIRRVNKRLKEMRDAMISRLEEVDRNKVDKDWFLSEEYQTMLFEAARQVTTTADRKKIAMLGSALANGCISDFSSETRKELFLQLIRELTPQHIAMLRKLVPHHDSPFGIRGQWQTRPAIIPEKDDDLAVLQMLAGSGLVTESVKPPKVRQPRFGGDSISEARHILSEFIKDLQQSPEREFRLSEFGRDFLTFISFSKLPE